MKFEDGHRRIWRLALTLFGLIFFGTLLAGEHFIDRGVSHIMRLSAERRVHDWLLHIRQEHHDLLEALRGAGASRYIHGKMQREAHHYAVRSFQVTDMKGRLLASDAIGAAPPPPSLRLPDDLKPRMRMVKDASTPMAKAGASTMPKAAQAPADAPLVAVNAPVRDLDGRVIGQLRARVDLADLHVSIENWVRQLVMLTMLALFMILGVAWIAYRLATVESRKHMARLTKEDDLTGLPNRRRCLEDMAAQLGTLSNGGKPFAFMLVNIHNFDRIASLHGPVIAERLLQTITHRIRNAIGDRARIYRFDSDNFALIVPEAAADVAGTVGRAVLTGCARPVQSEAGLLHPAISVGIVMVPEDADSVDQIVRRATMVCWAAMRKSGHGVLFYTPELEAVQARGGHMERLIKTALRENRLEMHFQPLVRLVDGRLHGFEALLRMRDENGDLVGPDEFIPLAEEMGLMEDFGAFALRESCRTAAQWPEHLSVAVNLSPLQFESGALPALVRDALRIADLPPQRLELEVTESLLLEDSRAVLDQLHALKAMGIRIALDDFGTGYSSLSYLWRFPFDKIKIDRSFIADMDKHPDVQTVLRATLAMARSMRLPVTAEGIEHEYQAEWLRRHHCQLGQGWLFGRPQPAEKVVEVILADRRKENGVAAERENTAVEILAVHRQKRA